MLYRSSFILSARHQHHHQRRRHLARHRFWAMALCWLYPLGPIASPSRLANSFDYRTLFALCLVLGHHKLFAFKSIIDIGFAAVIKLPLPYWPSGSVECGHARSGHCFRPGLRYGESSMPTPKATARQVH